MIETQVENKNMNTKINREIKKPRLEEEEQNKIKNENKEMHR